MDSFVDRSSTMDSAPASPGAQLASQWSPLSAGPFRPVHDERMRVLVVEDHVALAARIAEGLRDSGMAVDRRAR
jgi:hypothetical protein